MLAVEASDYSETGKPECDKETADSEPHDDALIEADQNVYEERFRVDRRKLEQMLRGDDGCEVNAAEEFFQKVMQQTGTQITWPSKLKIGAKSKKDPHIKVTGDPQNVKAAKEHIMTVLDTKSNRVTLKMDVSYTEHSHVIGKGGANIKRVMQATGCHIHFPDSNRSSQMMEKSNQVSIAGSPLGVENARLQIRDLLPLVIVLELPIAGVLQPDADDTTSVVQRVQQMYGVSITFKQRPPCLTTVVVRGTVGHAKAVKEATSRLIEHLSASIAPAVPVSLQMDISQQHQLLLFSRNSSSLKQITQQTGTTVHFPDLAAAASLGLASQLLPPCRPGMAYITGTLDAVYQTRQLIIGCLPLVLMFDMKEDIIVDQSLISRLAEELDVFISIKPKPKQPSRSVIVKSVERNAANIFEARRRLLGLTLEDDEANDAAFISPLQTMPRQADRSPESGSSSGMSMRNSPDVFSTTSEASRTRDGQRLMPASPSPRSGSPLTSATLAANQANSASNNVPAAVTAAAATAMVTAAATWATQAGTGMTTVISQQAQQMGGQHRPDGGSSGGGPYGSRLLPSAEPRLGGSWNLPSGGLRPETGSLPGRRLGMPPSSRPGLSGLRAASPADCAPQNGLKASSSEIDLPASLEDAGTPFHDLKRLLISNDSASVSPRRLAASGRAASPTVLDGNVPYQNGSIYRSSEELAAEGGCTGKRAPGAERAAAMRKPLPPPPPGLTGPPNPTSVSDALADYERKKLLATKAIQQEPVGETRNPTDFWSGLGFSKSMPDSVIRDRLRQSGALRYLAPSMETTFEAAGDSENERDSWNEPSPTTRTAQLPEDFLLKRFDYGLSSSNHLDASSPPPQHTSWSAAGLQQRSKALPSPGAASVSEGGLPAGTAGGGGGSVSSSVTDLATLLSSMSLGKYIDLFHQQEIDLATFLTLSDGDLKELGITTFGARRKMLLAIADLKKRPTFSPTPGPNNPFRASSTTMARRHDIVSQSGRW